MLAYTTVSDLFVMPSGLEVVVYLAGLGLMLALPSIFFAIIDSRAKQAKNRPETSKPSVN